MPSYNVDGKLSGKSTVPLDGEYFDDSVRATYLNADDTISGNDPPWGLSARVPMYVVSPWSKGGWVNSQVFDHTSVGMFLEKRFGITVDTISPWHRAVCGDLTSAFDFDSPNDPTIPKLPDTSDFAAIRCARRGYCRPPTARRRRRSRCSRRPACVFRVHCPTSCTPARGWSRAGKLSLVFANSGKQGAVFHVYDKLHLDRIPRRYTVEAGKTLTRHLEHGPLRQRQVRALGLRPQRLRAHLQGRCAVPRHRGVQARDPSRLPGPQRRRLHLRVRNSGKEIGSVTITSNAYRR